MGCRPDAPQTGSSTRYFSLENYFREQIAVLEARGQAVEKTVKKDDREEKRTIADMDWTTELEAFIASDINKPAWRDSYSVDSGAHFLNYRALEDGLRVRSIHIGRDQHRNIRSIVIERAENNYLYSSRETLRYYPDSLYSIMRHQHVRVLGPTRFQVCGKL